jgi:hypothetical protein
MFIDQNVDDITGPKSRLRLAKDERLHRTAPASRLPPFEHQFARAGRPVLEIERLAHGDMLLGLLHSAVTDFSRILGQRLPLRPTIAAIA